MEHEPITNAVSPTGRVDVRSVCADAILAGCCTEETFRQVTEDNTAIGVAKGHRTHLGVVGCDGEGDSIRLRPRCHCSRHSQHGQENNNFFHSIIY